MIIAGLTFKLVTSYLDGGNPTIFVHKHLASGKFFPSFQTKPRKTVAACAYGSLPKVFKDFVVKEPSDHQLWACEIPGADSIDLKRNTAKVSDDLFTKGKLIFRKQIRHTSGNLANITVKSIYHICTAVQAKTGAHYVFVVNKNLCESDTFGAKLKTHNGYVVRDTPHVNRTMHAFAKKHKPLDIGQWHIERDVAEYVDEETANRIATKVSKDLMLAGKVVLNRVCGNDPLHYYNQILRLPNLNMERYITR